MLLSKPLLHVVFLTKIKVTGLQDYRDCCNAKLMIVILTG